MDRARRFRIYHAQEDADDAPTYIAHVGSPRNSDPWQCEYCHHLNPADERSCQTCGHPRRDPPEREEP